MPRLGQVDTHPVRAVQEKAAGLIDVEFAVEVVEPGFDRPVHVAKFVPELEQSPGLFGVYVADDLQVTDVAAGECPAVVIQTVNEDPAATAAPGIGRVDVEFEIEIVEILAARRQAARYDGQQVGRVSGRHLVASRPTGRANKQRDDRNVTQERGSRSERFGGSCRMLNRSNSHSQ